MDLLQAPPRQPQPRFVLLVVAMALVLAVASSALPGGQPKVDTLRIGTSGSLTATNMDPKKEEGALQTLKSFIEEETSFKNVILRQKDWMELAEKMAKGQLEVGVFQGYEFAWAQDKYPDLKPLAIAVNTYRYPTVYVLVKGDNPAKDFAGLKGQSVSLPNLGQRYLDLFVESQSQAAGKTTKTFFSKIAAPDNVEDALDDVVDGVIQVAVVDEAAKEAYKRRKPGRFKQLREVAHSEPFPPGVVAYFGKNLNAADVKRLEAGLLGAHRKEKGETMLTLFRLTSFEAIPADLGKVLAQSRKNYPPPNAKAK